MAFLQTSGTKFTLNRNLFPLFGCTIYDDLYFPGSIPAKMAAINTAGYNTVRFTNFMNGSPAAGSEFDSGVYAIIDLALDEARKNNLKVIVDLTDILTICGNRGYTHGSPEELLVYQNYFNFIGNRVNTINGRTYKNDDTLAIWSMFSEGGEVTTPGGNRTFLTTLFGYAKAALPNHLVQPGGQHPEQILPASYGLGGYVPNDSLTIPLVDACSTEPYYEQDAMLSLFPLLQSYSIANNKPWFCNEFGYNMSDKAHQNDFQRAKNMKFVYQQGLKYGCAGFIFWNFDYGTFGGYGINPGTQETYNMVRIFAKTTGYSPRLLVI